MSYITNLAKALYKDKFFQRAVCSISSSCSGSGGGDVTSIFGRTGAVTAQSGDYTFSQIGSKPTTISGYGITDAVTTSQINQANGVAGVDSGGKIPVSLLPNSVMTLEGQWNAATNTPTLVNGTGNPGMVYEVTTAGTQNFGQGDLEFDVGDWVVYGANGIWYLSPNGNEVTSVFGRKGTVVAQSGDYTASQVTGAIAQGGNSFSGAMEIGTNDNNRLDIKTNNQVALSIAANGNVFGNNSTSANNGFLTPPRTATTSWLFGKNSSNSQAVLQIANDNQTSTGNIVEFLSNTDGTARVLKSYVAKDGSITAPNLIYQGGNSFGGNNMVIGTDDAGFLQLKQNGGIRMIFSGANIYGPTVSSAFGYISLGASQGVPAFNVSKNATTGDATIMTVNNLSSTSNGNLIDFSSNIGGTTAVRASIAKDGTIIAPNIQSVNNVSSSSLTLDGPGYYTNTGAAVTYTVPNPAGRTGIKYTLINMGSGSISATGGFEDIWEAGTLVTNVSVAAGEVITLYNNGSKWIVI